MKKISFKKAIALVMILVMSVSLYGCGTSETNSTDEGGNASGEKIVWKIGHNNPEDHQWQKNADMFEQLVEEATDGQIDVQSFPNSLLGDDAAMGEMIRNGNLDMMYTGGCIPGKWYRPMSMVEAGGLFKDMEHVERAIYGEAGEIMKAGCEENGFMLWDNWIRARWQILSTTPIRSLEDAKGLKMRVPQDEAFIKSFEAVGMNPTPVAFSEAFTSLQQGVVDAICNPISSMYTMRFHEVCDYLVIPDSYHDFTSILVSPQSWEKLTPELQEILWDCEQQVKEANREITYNEEEVFIEKMQQDNPDLEVIYVDSEVWTNQAATALDDIAELLGAEEMVEAIQKVAEE